MDITHVIFINYSLFLARRQQVKTTKQTRTTTQHITSPTLFIRTPILSNFKMPPQFPGAHRRNESQPLSRGSILPGAAAGTTSSAAAAMSATKSRQYAHLHSQLAQLNAHLADTENLVRMTAVQAGDMRFLGGYIGGLFMGAAKVLGEEGVKGAAAATAPGKDGDDEVVVKEES